jgi:nitroimidazol reductase NimA-like FMN-containing flavoprotein (pyridoxamine 5'-phosphate oxidase superfamily)
MIGNLNPEEINEVLHQHIVGRIGCHAGGKTYVVPVSYAYDGESIFAHSSDGMKIKIMRQNPDVCFEVDDINNMANWKSVIAFGRFEEILDPDRRKQAVQLLLDRILPLNSSITTHLGKEWPFRPSDLNSITGIVYRIAIQEKTGRFENNTYSAKLQG